jgi:hypothetical protein
MNKLNLYNNVSSPSVVKDVSVGDWFSMIKGSDYSDLIMGARSGELDYEKVKSSQMPCVTYNFLYDSYKKDSNIISPTGLIYFDIDDPSFNPDSVDKSKVYAMYRSFGGLGWAIIVKVDGLTKENFAYNYTLIAKNIGAEGFVDINARKASQFSILSFDKDIYVNDNTITFVAEQTKHTPKPFPIHIKSGILRGLGGVAKPNVLCEDMDPTDIPLRFDNLGDIEFEGDFTANWDGYDWVKCWIPMKKTLSNRNSTLLSYCNNLVWLNPHITKERTIRIMYSVNEIAFVEPLNKKKVLGIVDSIFTYLSEGSLRPLVNNKKRKIVFKKKSDLTADDKRSIVLALCTEKRVKDTREKIYSILENWDFEKYGRVSSLKVYNNFPISKNTVEKYWKEFKGYAGTLNESFESGSITKTNIPKTVHKKTL